VFLAACEPAPTAKPSATPSHPIRHTPAPLAHRDKPAVHRDAVVTLSATQPIREVQAGPGGISLTIDDGPGPVYTPQVLELLASYHVTAAFAMVGRNVAAYPSLARQVADAGHMIVNHTWQHPNLRLLAPPAIRDQIDRTTGAIHAAAGVTPRMFRAPFGAWSPVIIRLGEQAGMAPLGWSVDPRDWSRPGAGAIIRNIMANTKAGSIILEHDGGGDRSQTVAALKVIIPRLLDRGFSFFPP